MTDSLRDQLLGLGFRSAPKPGRPAITEAAGPGKPRPGVRVSADRPQQRHEHKRAQMGRPATGGKPRLREDIDLAKAYAIRAQREKDERIAAERTKQEQARERREARVRLAALLEGKALNDDTAEIARYFEYGGKIKRIHVTAEQLKALNAGELGVVQLNGRYLLVSAGVLAQAEAIFPQSVALKVDPQASTTDEYGDDARHQVPDDLIW